MKARAYLAIVLPVPIFIICCHLWNNSGPRVTDTFRVIDSEQIESHFVEHKHVSADHRGQPGGVYSLLEEVDEHFLVTIRISDKPYQIVVPMSDQALLEDQQIMVEYRLRRSGALRVHRILD